MYPCNSGPFSGVSQNFENELDDLKDNSLKEEKLQGSRPQCAMEDEYEFHISSHSVYVFI